MLKGVDVSTWQGSMSFRGYDFVMIRASYGVGNPDRMMKTHVDRALKEGKLIGFYHYAYPEYNTGAVNEADWFISQVKPYLGKCILALDFEGSAFTIKSPATWAKAFMDRVKEKTGVKCVLYTSASKLPIFNNIAQADYGLWVAHWGVSQPSIYPWKIWALWQYRGSPLDLDYFSGDKEAWYKYAKSNQSEDKPKPKPSTGLKVGDKVEIINTGNGSSYGTSNVAYGIGYKREILAIYSDRAYPYQVGNSTGTTGFYKKEALKKL